MLKRKIERLETKLMNQLANETQKIMEKVSTEAGDVKNAKDIAGQTLSTNLVNQVETVKVELE